MLIIWCDVTQLIGPLIVPDPVLGKIASYRLWFEKRLGDAIQAADANQAIDLQPMPNDDDEKGQNDEKKNNERNG